MKYYKLIKPEDYVIEGNKIYPGNLGYGYGNSNIEFLSKCYPEDWQEVPTSEYWLQEGELPEEYVVSFINTDSLKDRQEVYSNFYKDDYEIAGKWNYIICSSTIRNAQFSTGQYSDKWCIEYYIRDEFKHLPIFTYQQWKQLKDKNQQDMEFKLPEKWCIKRNNENYEAINEWMNNFWNLSNRNVEFYDGSTGFVNNENISKNWDYKHLPEITFDQFKKYVLNQQDMSKEIIGYKLKEDCKQYEESACRIIANNTYYKEATKFSDMSGSGIKGVIFTKNSYSEELLEKAGVLDLWFEPVYKEDKFKIGDIVIVTEAYSDNYAQVGRLVKIIDIDDNSHSNVKYNCIDYLKLYNWPVTHSWCKEVRKATPEEIKSALIEIAKQKGFKEGVKTIHGTINSNYSEYDYKSEEDMFYVHNIRVYHKGQWAEILPSYPEITINGYKGEFYDWGISFNNGCAKIGKEVFIDLNKIISEDDMISNRNIESVIIGKGTFTKEQIRIIAEYYINK